jgi:acetylornithine deacetylase
MISEAVAGQREWMEQLLAELVAAPTVLGHEEAGQAIMARAFAECGLEALDVPLRADRLRADPHHSPFSWEVGAKRNVVATWAAGREDSDARSLILNGHVDVVPPASAGLWATPPFEPRRDGDWLYGRGAGDMKAGLVAMAGAVRALRALDVRLGAALQLQSVVEEECTGNGTLQCLLDGHRADAAVLTEPHPDHFAISQLGVLWFEVDVRGRPAHAARAKALGHNAIEAAATVLTELRALEAELNADPPPPYDAFAHPINLNPGIVHAGDWASTVPAECTIAYRLACYPGTEPAQLRARVQDAVARAAQRDDFLRENPPRVRYDGFSCEGCTVDAGEPLVGELAEAYRAVHGAAPDLRATTATSDARHFVRHGIPAVQFGPRAEEIHGIDERASLSSMVEVAEILARFVMSWCRGETPHPVRGPVHRGESHVVDQ